jgi:type II secretory pathway component PulL
VADFLGVSLGRDEVAFAVVSRRRNQLNVTLTGRIEYEEPVPDVAARASLAAARAAETGLPRAAVAIALPGEEIFLQPHTVPFTRGSHIEQTLAFEMADKLPFDVDSAVLDFSVISSEGPNSRILVAALQRAVLESVVAPFTAAGFKVRLVTSEVLAAGALAVLAERDSYALLDVSPSGWHLAICDSGRLVFARAAPATPTDAALEAPLAGWFRQSLSAGVTDLRPPVVILSGSRAGGIDIETLADRIELPVELLSLSDVREDEAAREPAEEPVEGAPLESISEGEEPPLTPEDSFAAVPSEDVRGGEAPEAGAEGPELAAPEDIREGEAPEEAAEGPEVSAAPQEIIGEGEEPPLTLEEPAAAEVAAPEGVREGEEPEAPAEATEIPAAPAEDIRKVEAPEEAAEGPEVSAAAPEIFREGEGPALTLEEPAAAEVAAPEAFWEGETAESAAEGAEAAAVPPEGVGEGDVSEAIGEDITAAIAPPEGTFEIEIPPAIDEEAGAPDEAAEGAREGEPVMETGGDPAAASGALLAAVALCRGAATMDLLRAARGRRRLSEALFGPVACGLVLVTLVCGVLSWGHLRQTRLHTERREAAEQAEMQVWRDVFPETEPLGGNVNRALKSAVRELEEAGGGAATANCAWFLRALYVLSANLPANHSHTFEKFDANPEKLTINVSTDGSDPEEKSKVAERINEEGTFSARITDVATKSGGKTTYKIVIAPKGEGGE